MKVLFCKNFEGSCSAFYMCAHSTCVLVAYVPLNQRALPLKRAFTLNLQSAF